MLPHAHEAAGVNTHSCMWVWCLCADTYVHMHICTTSSEDDRDVLLAPASCCDRPARLCPTAGPSLPPLVLCSCQAVSLPVLLLSLALLLSALRNDQHSVPFTFASSAASNALAVSAAPA